MSYHAVSIAILLRPGPEGSGIRPADDSSAAVQAGLSVWRDRLQPWFEELILVCTEPESHLAWKGLIVRGNYRPKAALAAVYAALTVAQNSQLLTLDPLWSFLSPTLVRRVASAAEQRWDVLALAMGSDEPLPMVFHSRCLKSIERHLGSSSNRFEDFFARVRVHTLRLEDLSPTSRHVD